MHHHAEIDDVVVGAPEHHADDVLADVVDVALHGGEHDRAIGAVGDRAAGGDRRLALGLEERCEIGDRLLHHASRLDDLRQEHPAGAEQVTDDVHAVHQRALDHRDR